MGTGEPVHALQPLMAPEDEPPELLLEEATHWLLVQVAPVQQSLGAWQGYGVPVVAALLQAQNWPPSSDLQYWLEQLLLLVVPVQGWPTATLAAPELPPLEPPLEPPLGGVQVPFTQVPVQQSVLLVQVLPAPALALSGMQEVQSEEMSQPVGQVTLPQFPASAAVAGEQPLHAATARTAAPKPRKFLRDRAI